MERDLLVFMELAGETVSVGTLWTRTRGARETAFFEYDPSWLARRDAFGLEPMLPPGRGPFHTDRPVFNAFTDAAPDRWGQTLMRRNERRRVPQLGRPASAAAREPPPFAVRHQPHHRQHRDGRGPAIDPGPGDVARRRSPRSMRPITRCAAISRLPSFCGARDRGERGPASALAPNRIQYAGFQYRRPSSQSRLPP